MGGITLSKEDVTESFIRSSGPGGQNVNKVASCVVLCHKPTGIIVKCQQHRSQHLNRQEAWELLTQALEEKQAQEHRAIVARKEKQRRKNRKPSKAAKQRALENKRHRRQKKENRKGVKNWD